MATKEVREDTDQKKKIWACPGVTSFAPNPSLLMSIPE